MPKRMRADELDTHWCFQSMDETTYGVETDVDFDADVVRLESKKMVTQAQLAVESVRENVTHLKETVVQAEPGSIDSDIRLPRVNQ